MMGKRVQRASYGYRKHDWADRRIRRLRRTIPCRWSMRREARWRRWTTFVGQNMWIAGLIIFALGVIGAAVHAERTAYCFAGITVVIVMMIATTNRPSVVAL